MRNLENGKTPWFTMVERAVKQERKSEGMGFFFFFNASESRQEAVNEVLIRKAS